MSMRTFSSCFLLFVASAYAFAPGPAMLGSRSSSRAASCISQRPLRSAAVRVLTSLRMDSEVVPNAANAALLAGPGEAKQNVERSELEITDTKKKSCASESKLLVIGLSHHSATVEIREKLAVPEPQWQEVGREIANLPSINEAAVLSTCNRFEIYIAAEDMHKGAREVMEYLNRRSSLSLSELRTHLFTLSEMDGAWHGLRVAGGLDSLVVGEGQILSQMKRCYELATSKEGAAGKVLNRLLNTAVSAGKRVRAETAISRGGVSISSAAVELVERKSVEDLGLEMDQLDICILGAGKMARLLVQHLTPRSPKSIHICNRSPERPNELKEMFPDSRIVVHTMDEMLEQIGSTHVTFACTSAVAPILTKDNMAETLKKPTMLVDISVPRNVEDKEINTLANGIAYNVDDLKAVVAANQAKRRKLILEAEDLLKEELETFGNWQQSLGTVPTINRLQVRAERIRRTEIHKMHNKLSGLTPTERACVERLTKGIVAKLIHGPMSHLRTVDSIEERTNTVKSLEQMFKL